MNDCKNPYERWRYSKEYHMSSVARSCSTTLPYTRIFAFSSHRLAEATHEQNAYEKDSVLVIRNVLRHMTSNADAELYSA